MPDRIRIELEREEAEALLDALSRPRRAEHFEAKLRKALAAESCDCDPEGHLAAECVAQGCRAALAGQESKETGICVDRDLAERFIRTMGRSPATFDVERELTRVLQAALVPESGEGRCGGSGRIKRNASRYVLGPYLPCPGCPDCHPQSKEEEDWPPILVARDPQHLDRGPWIPGNAEAAQRTFETRRYIPAPEEEEAA